MGNYTNNQSSGGWKDKRGGDRGGRGGRDFGSINTWKRDGDRGGDRDDRPQMHSATCAECGERCEVPFKPTGSKPVYCSNCFRKDDSRSLDRPRSFDRPRSDKPAYQSTPRDNNDEVVKQLKTIGIKMDKMISLLMELSGAVDGEVYEEIDGLDLIEDVEGIEGIEEVKEKKDKKAKKTKIEKEEVKAKKEKKAKKTKAKAKAKK
ncbi:MAG: hypothetical protein UU46_C0003G0008 [Candidatus Uhrbacteria bacterium GW2011_GWD1_41_16]|uniref:CxxC-x17-CxxC domain-containing protein n=1 Tax=Candidatus Uhrbacteria bacterium GW2011_GWC1_41_20 TaxID=1618983 RepID=A0A0G0XR73_9BACT|nr:MAG: hypothetical protein UT52_C0005G0033 [Candidatus Uhrbacteria bacterium GW2011_GWE1_39_46]KKR63619.1 MAG: hypothetical protein UU04_C0015G0008 [Candidatus Uhrbacteria bacterium GW2011_GWC2_40_450]KKR96391.1 MAG: hypothetical protein UU46_C0003G0008 [Candidatus Uhrbacteria bacterium GW2011_GWD1_41_16]KKR99405.1 MAG: hypothetical protein UU50_C0006G0008 [Candidatus Uhrbacteria bacterium GW2011_GWC1_41_20]KKS08363.1 MAG: hypothetical protein UU62_C0002G0033 [Candidatus Uhrbacteria bacterium